ncbi:multi-sensor hybrid histidine kinase [Stanieria cyanosphaera PCC 7437]|uniref:Circadian input-output histidine kinase CikA n=1 Tax=Stanieria cyanosphaera (strain ATCC 29371 / PCC 7437) TaxID=111780 RepID=K9XWY9_STAC7|nr:PAS domain S-box protein [Stanieria cyanosphaera]AFZ36579.1 multi-sensor hybrid histidine kinase [Stanieria cyanosphaera PCC 7437]
MVQIPRTILIVDDASEARKYRRYLVENRAYSYTVLEASRGQQGLELWQQHQPDLILLNAQLPDLNGLEFLARLQSLIQQTCLPVIMMSKPSQEAIALQALKAGAQDYLVKEQITPARLDHSINRVIETAQLRSELQRRIEKEQLIAQITLKIAQTFNLNEILQTTVTEVRRFLQSDRSLIFRLDLDGWGEVITESVADQWTSLLSTSLSASCLSENYLESFHQGLVTVQSDLHDGRIAPAQVELLANLQVRANLVAPIVVGERLWGMLIVHHCAAPRQWQRLEVDLVQELAIELGIALQQSELAQKVESERLERQKVELKLRESLKNTQLAEIWRESAAQFRQLAENIDAVFWIREELEQRVSYVSPAYERLWGLDPQELYKNPLVWGNYIHPDDREAIAFAFQEKAAKGEFDQEYRIILPDGSIRWIRDRCFPLQDETGKIYRFTGIAEDITKRKQAELERQRSEATLQGFLAASPIALVLFDRELRFLYANEALARLNELPLSEHLGRTLAEVMPLMASKFAPMLLEIMATQEPVFNLEFSGEIRPGVFRSTIANYYPVCLANGEVIGVGVSVTDTTELRQTEIALQQTTERLNVALKSAPLTLFNQDLELRYTWIYNPTHNYSIAEVIGKRDEDLASPDTAASLTQLKQQVLATGIGLREEVKVTRNEQTTYYDLTIDPIKARHNAIVGITCAAVDITERKEFEEHLRYTIELNPQVPWTANPAGDITDLSERWLELTGLTREQSLGKGWMQVIHPDDLSAVVAAWTNSFKTGVAYDIEYRIKLTDDSYCWVRSRAFPRRSEHNEIVRWYGTTEDIDDRKKSEEALRISEEQFRTIANAAPALVWVCSVTGEIVFMNERWYEYTGQSQEEVKGFGWTSTLHPDDTERILSHWQHCYTTGEPYEGEGRYRQKNGEYRWHRFRALPQRNELGIIEKWFGCSVDIHDAKRAEEVIAANEAKLRGFVDANVVGMLYGDIYGNIYEANDKLLKIVGYTREELRAGKLRWIDITPPEYLPLDQQAIAEALLKGACTPYEKEYLRPDGSRVPILLGYSLVGEAREESVAFILDLSERKQAEQEREQLLQREQSARQEAERANRIKDEFLAILSHELRSPLNPILGWAQMLQTGRLDSIKTTEGLATIERNAKLQTQLIDDLLDVAKILRGKLSMKMASVNLALVIEAAIGTVRAAALAKSIHLEVKLPQIGQVFGDAARLQQIIWNLLSNAIKFTPNHGRVDIQLSLVVSQSSTIKAKYAKIIVSDTGKGIKPEFLPYIFESFRQEDASTTRKYGGLGLGLAIVRYLVEAHGGTIWADSKGDGQGATFTVRLPLLNSKPILNQSETLSTQELDLTGIRILTVDDEPDARNLLTVLLTQYGAEVLSVASTTEVLANLESFQPDLLISDIGMPNLDGYSLIEQVRALPPEKGGEVNAIALTAYAREEDRQQALSKGYQWHINKPLEPEQLIRAVISLVSHQTQNNPD